MDTKSEPSIRTEIDAFVGIPCAERTADDKKRLNDLRHHELQTFVENVAKHNPAVGDKRQHFDLKLSNIADIAPSSFAEPRGKRCWSANYSALGLKFHRPTREQCGIHTSLMSRELGVFVDNAREVQLTHDDYAFTLEFCDAMSGSFASEGERQAEARSLLSTYFGQGQSSNTGGVLVTCGTHKNNVFPVLFVEYKWELCSSKAAPGEQNIGYYMKNVHESGFARERSACPALLLTIAGPNVGISAAVHGAGPCVDPVVPLLPTLVLKQDKRMMTVLARALKACKLCIEGLTNFYGALSNSVPPFEEVQQLMYPYPRSFLFEGHEVPFAYGRQLGNKLVFNAHVTAGTHGLATDLNIIVKFTDTYCVDAHNLCYECDESAPRLYSQSLLPGGWHMVVMERLAGADFKPQRESDSVQHKLIQVWTV